MKHIILKIKSFDKITVNLYIIFLREIFNVLKIKTNFIINLPSKKKRITLLKSPHVHKKSMEQFQLQLFTKLISLNIKNDKILMPFIYINKPKNVKLNFYYINKN